MAWLGVFEAFKLFWFLPLLAIVRTPRGSRRLLIAGLALTFCAGALQLLISHDTSRHVGHSFMTVLLGAKQLREVAPDRERFARNLLLLVAANLLVPQYYVGQQRAWPFLPLPVSLLLLLFGLDPWKLPRVPWG
jgi:peptidoglycan/LPS O-acetylase OafA/YrhL